MYKKFRFLPLFRCLKSQIFLIFLTHEFSLRKRKLKELIVKNKNHEENNYFSNDCGIIKYH